MLAFEGQEVEISKGSKEMCVECGKRRAMWCAVDGEGEKVSLCGWCLLYCERSKWGYERREEILYVGKAAQEHAAKAGKVIPSLDNLGRLMPEDAERFLLGVAFTSKMLGKVFKMARMAGEI